MTTAPITSPTAPIDLITLLTRVKTDIFSSMFCIQIGTIESYNKLTNTAKVSINFEKKFINGQIAKYPILEDVPVFILGGGDACITMPIAQNDQCLVLFCDRNIDNWWANGDKGIPNDVRMHSIADGFALVGIRNLVTAKLTPANSVCIDAGSKKIAIKNSQADLKTLFDNLLTAIGSITVTTTAAAGTWPLSITGAIGFAGATGLKAEFAKLLDEGLL